MHKARNLTRRLFSRYPTLNRTPTYRRISLSFPVIFKQNLIRSINHQKRMTAKQQWRVLRPHPHQTRWPDPSTAARPRNGRSGQRACFSLRIGQNRKQKNKNTRSSPDLRPLSSPNVKRPDIVKPTRDREFASHAVKARAAHVGRDSWWSK